MFGLLGSEVLSPEELQEVVDAGIVPDGTSLDLIESQFVLGQLEALLKQTDYKKITYDQLKEKAATFQPKTLYESKSVEEAKASAGVNLRKLGDDVKNGLYSDLQEGIRGEVTEGVVTGKIKDVVAHGLEERRSTVQVGLDLARELKASPAHDYLLLAATEMQAARVSGYVSAILNREGKYEFLVEEGRELDTYIFFRPSAGACSDCVKSYVNPKTGNPYVFRLGDIMANGTNIGVPKKDRTKGSTGKIPVRAVLSPHHPFCQCQPQIMPAGYGFDEDGDIILQDPKKANPEMADLGLL